MSAVLEEQRPALRPFAELRAESGFAWSCRTAEVEYGRVVRACETSGSDRGEYAAHMKSHGLAPVKSAYERPKPWAPPRPVRVYAPKPMAAGERCEWVKTTGGHHEIPARMDGDTYVPASGEWIPAVSEQREGTVWSVATSASEWWILPDGDESRPVLVKRAGKRGWPHKEGELYEVIGAADSARANVLRAELIRKRGIFAVVDCVTRGSTWGYGGGSEQTYVKWHSDPSCPEAEGKDRYDREAHGHAYGYGCDEWGTRAWSPIQVAIALTSGKQAPSALCATCIVNLDVESPAEVPAVDDSPASVAPEPVPEADGALFVSDVEDGAHSAVYEVSYPDGERAAYADMLGPGATIRVLWGGHTLTPELCAQVREAVTAWRAGFDPATGIGPDDQTWRILCSRSTPDKRRDYALMSARRAYDDAIRAAGDVLAADLEAAGDELALQRAAREYEAEARSVAREACRRVCGDVEAAYAAETAVPA